MPKVPKPPRTAKAQVLCCAGDARRGGAFMCHSKSVIKTNRSRAIIKLLAA